MRYNNNTLYISRRNKNMTVPERLSALRKCMEEKNIDVYVVPTADFHQSEYVGEHFKARKFITGFSGSAGTAVITAKCGNYKATCKITVKKPTVKATASVNTLFVGGTSQVKVDRTGLTGKVTYGSSSKSVATVSTSGKITAKKAGTATITVKCGSYKATCKITVKKGSLKITSKTAVTVKTKKTTAIKAAATSKITYRSSNTKVATVSSKGVVKGVKKGKAVIYVSSNGVTKKVTVTVK